MKILFYHHNIKIETHSTLERANGRPSVFIGLAGLYLKTYLDIKKPNIAKQVEWHHSQQLRIDDDELVSLIKKEKVDLLCTTHYIWNYKALLDQLKRIRSRVPDVKFLAGGPSVDVNINDSYFKDYNFIDYAFYGAGEKSFAEFVEKLVNKEPLISSEMTNMAWPDEHRNAIVADFEYVPQSKISPFIYCEEMFTKIIEQIRTQNAYPIVPYELTRGCPYACTFCDWNSGLTNKTTRRKESYKDEIDLFCRLKLQDLYLADANVGQYQEDIDMIEYLAEKNLQHSAGFKIDGNFSKLRKDNNLKIYHVMAKSNMCNNFVISLQDSNPTILENIDRPDVGWDEHAKIISELTENYPHIPALVQLIQGLPGQTVSTWRQTLSDVVHQENVLPLVYVNELLSASPAARDKTYTEKWNFVYSNSIRWDTFAQSEFKSPFSKSCSSFTELDFIEMCMLTLIYSVVNHHIRNLQVQDIKFDIESIVDRFLVSELYTLLKNNLTENWLVNDKFYFTVGIDGKPQAIPTRADNMITEEIIPKIASDHNFLKWTIQGLSTTISASSKKQYARYVFDTIKDQSA